MTLLEELVKKYALMDFNTIFSKVSIDTNQIDSTKINEINHQDLKEVTLAQWLLESGRANSKLSVEANNFAGLKWRSEMNKFATKHNIQVPSEPAPVDFCKFDSVDTFIIGYWRFLARSPYDGLEQHTNAPDTFIGFLQRKGYAADLDYVNKVIRLVPEAHDLLTKANGIVISAVPARLQVTRAPQEVELRQSFRIEGVASTADKGKVVLIKIDDRFDAQGTPIAENGKWQADLVFTSLFTTNSVRKVRFSVDSQSVDISIKATTPIDANDDDNTPQPSGSIVINLTGSVGSGGFNKDADVKAVKKRLYDLGYTWVGDPNNKTITTGTVQAIKLFQSIVAGHSILAGDGRIDIGGPTHRWLQAANAPVWQTMPSSDLSVGFVNHEKDQTGDDHDFGTNWLADTIKAIAKDFQTSYRTPNPGAAPFALNDISRPHGGDTPDHAGHETGLMCDVFLPKKDGKFGGIDFTSRDYDQSATRALIKSMRKQKLVRAVFFNDPILIKERLCSHAAGHHHHIHFEINPPVRT
jgi:hypothetical protein